MKLGNLPRTVLTAISLTILTFNLAAADSDSSFSWQGPVSPSELHQMMGEYKAEALGRSRMIAAMAEVEATSTQTNYDVIYYDITIRVDDTNQYLYGVVEFIAEAAEASVSEVEVDFYSNMAIDSIVSPAGPLSYSRTGNVVTVTLDQIHNLGEQFKFNFYYNGHPIEGGLQAFSFGSYDDSPSISSLSEPYSARSWWPCKDRMDDKPDSIDIHIEVDTSLYVGSNGLLDSVTTDGGNTHTYHWRVRYPIATYLFSVAIHPFIVWEQEYIYNNDQDTMPIVHAVYSNYYDTSLTTWGQTPQMLEILSDLFGPYPFLKEKYGHANFGWGGAMEHQTMTSMAGSLFGFRIAVIVHEMGHQWWGDMITCESWEDIWLNEGWASYTEPLYYLTTEGWNSYHSYMDGMRYTGGGTVWCDDTTSVNRIFHGGLSYDKGAWVCHMLRGVLGDSLFFAGIDAYYHSEFQHASATTEDFKNVFEAATGEELDWFFEEWIYGTYYPKYDYYYMSEPSDSGGYDIYLLVRQVQNSQPQVFRMPVDFYFAYIDIPGDTLTLIIDQRERFFKFNAPSDIYGILLDPKEWILRDANRQYWGLLIITRDEDLSEAIENQVYYDTIDWRGGSGENQISIIDGSLPPGMTLTENGVINGVPSDTGLFTFTVLVNDLYVFEYRDTVEFTLYVAPWNSCCIGNKGNVQLKPDCDDSDQTVDISDLTNLIDHLFIGYADLCCGAEVDITPSPEPDGSIDIGDLTDLIDHLFITYSPLPVCQDSH